MPAGGRVLNPIYRERLFAFINEAPFVKHMGMRITHIAWGSAVFELAAAEYRLQPFGVVHGGNIATVIDSATFGRASSPWVATTTGSPRSISSSTTWLRRAARLCAATPE